MRDLSENITDMMDIGKSVPQLQLTKANYPETVVYVTNIRYKQSMLRQWELSPLAFLSNYIILLSYCLTLVKSFFSTLLCRVYQ